MKEKLTLSQWATRAICRAWTSADDVDLKWRDYYDEAQYNANQARISGCPGLEAEYEAQMDEADRELNKLKDRYARIQKAYDWLVAHKMWAYDLADAYWEEVGL